MKVNLGTLVVTSPEFEHGGRIPERFTMAGESISPPLSWSGVPEGTQSFALLVHDADAPMVNGFTHWVVWGIPADRTSIAEGESSYPSGANGLGREGWFPPGPPAGHGDHFYYFHLYALDAPLDLEPNADPTAFLAAVEEHVIAQARIVGVYGTD